MTALAHPAADLRAVWASQLEPAAPKGEPAPALLDACRRGDRGALDRVLREHAAGLERLLARLVGPRADVEDLLQETFAAAIVAFPRFRGEASVKTWLHRIAINVAHKFLRRPRHRREEPLVGEPAAAVEDTAPDDALGGRQVAERLYRHLEHLDADKRIALVLHVVDDLSIAEIAALTGASRAATKSRIFWGRRALLARVRKDPGLAGGER
jgi:RNA polymerase sigma-70 factor (ECF subfamily)